MSSHHVRYSRSPVIATSNQITDNPLILKKSNHRHNELAIVIPVYKAAFFREALQSLADQTCQQFRVYIGNDGSPHDIRSVVDSFMPILDISYVQFHDNLGKHNLIAHWERCIDLVEEEDWIWFFSDDDKMDPTCVELFYANIDSLQDIDIAHFNVRRINGQGERITKGSFPDFPSHFDAMEFCRNRLQDKQASYMVEFVFRKQKFLSVGRFEKFDLAWGSDVATCIKLAFPKGIVTIPNAYVYWRVSEHNISPNNSREMIDRKMAATFNFIEWLKHFCCDNCISLPINPLLFYVKRWVLFRGRRSLIQTFKDIAKLLDFNAVTGVPPK